MHDDDFPRLIRSASFGTRGQGKRAALYQRVLDPFDGATHRALLHTPLHGQVVVRAVLSRQNGKASTHCCSSVSTGGRPAFFLAAWRRSNSASIAV